MQQCICTYIELEIMNHDHIYKTVIGPLLQKDHQYQFFSEGQIVKEYEKGFLLKLAEKISD